LVLSQVGLNRLPEKVPEKVLGSLGAKPSQVLNGFCREGCREGPGKGFGNLWCRARSGSTGSGEGSGEVCFSSFCFSNMFVKIKCCGCWGYHRSLFFPYIFWDGRYSRI
jgi:hypothetical protein